MNISEESDGGGYLIPGPSALGPTSNEASQILGKHNETSDFTTAIESQVCADQQNQSTIGNFFVLHLNCFET